MDLSGLLVFAAAYLMATASPGPGVAALVARVLARGQQGVPAFIAGFVVGDLVWFSIAATGLAVLAQSFALLFLAIKYAGAAYLAFLAWKLWTAPATPVAPGQAPAGEGAVRLFASGLAITLGNPKVIVFFLALLPSVLPLGSLSLLGFMEVAGLIAVILSAVLAAYAMAATQARRAFTSAAAIRRVNRGSAVAIAGAAVVTATR